MTLPRVEPRSFLVIRTDGSEEVVALAQNAKVLAALRTALGFDTFDFVRIGKLLPLADRNSDLMMVVDDGGYEYEVVEHSPVHREHVATKAKKPANAKATAFYHAICVPGTTHQIVGDVAIFHDRDADA